MIENVTHMMQQNSNTAIKTHSFHVPRRLAKDDLLKRLSGDALRMYIFLSYKSYRCHKNQHLLLDWELVRSIGIPKDEVAHLRSELSLAALINYSVPSKNRALYTPIQDLKPISTKVRQTHTDTDVCLEESSPTPI